MYILYINFYYNNYYLSVNDNSVLFILLYVV